MTRRGGGKGVASGEPVRSAGSAAGDKAATLSPLPPTDDVTGPWNSTLAYVLPQPWSNVSRYYAYAVKLHPHLARSDDEMVITFVANAWNMSMLYGSEETMIYTPQVLRTNLTALLG